MDTPLRVLLLLSLALVILFAPHAAMMLGSIVFLSAIATRCFWALLQPAAPAPQPQRVWD
jgi:hypothetical protein